MNSESTLTHVVLYPLYLVHANGLAVELDHIHDLDGIVCIVLSHELDKAVALMQLGDPVTRHVDIHCREKGGETGSLHNDAYAH